MKAKIIETKRYCTISDLCCDRVCLIGYLNGATIKLEYDGPSFFTSLPTGELEMEIKLTHKPKIPEDIVIEFK